MEGKKALEKAVIYARYSSSGQREESIEGQLRECHAYAKKYGLNVIGEYCDHALSGTVDARPEFQRMIKDSAKRQFTVVLTWKHDRFARNRYDAAIYRSRLKNNGVRICYAKEAVPEGPEGIILESVMEGMAEYYSANLSQNVKRGLYDSALKRGTLGQTVYGLRKSSTGTFEINPDTAPIVKRIFEQYAAGVPAQSICKELNEAGYSTPRGKKFNNDSIRRIIKNEKYCGVYEYADIRDENGVPAIISRRLWEQAQEMLRKHHEKPAAKKIDGGFLLTGKLFCGHCGNPMTGDSGTSKTGRVYEYYTCTEFRKHRCDKKRAPKQSIEDIIVHKLMEIAADVNLIDAFADRYMIWQEKEKDRTELKALEVKLKSINAAIANTMKAIDSGIITESVKSHLIELESQKADIEAGIGKEMIEDPVLERDQVVFFLSRFRDGDADDVAFRIFLIETFLKAAYLYDDGRLILSLNFSGEKSEVSLSIAETAVSEGDVVCSDLASSAPPNSVKTNSYTTRTVIFYLGGLFVSFTRKKDL